MLAKVEFGEERILPHEFDALELLTAIERDALAFVGVIFSDTCFRGQLYISVGQDLHPFDQGRSSPALACND